ncbi:hypothetical protein H6F96_19485 [Microcoleus sp. FACHB-53]|nr:hypothetical protein [Microcoleus sp. FACHB-53]
MVLALSLSFFGQRRSRCEKSVLSWRSRSALAIASNRPEAWPVEEAGYRIV